MALLNRFRSLLDLHHFVSSPRYVVRSLEFSTATEKQGDDKETAQYGTLADEDEEEMMVEREAIIEAKRDKSRLNPAHRNILHGRVPYDEPMCDAHLTLQYKKRMFGRYGRSSGLDPGYLWPTPEEVRRKLEYDSIAHPYSLLELAERERAKRDAEAKAIDDRQKKIVENLKKLDQWKREVHQRAEKKLADVEAAKAKKEALMEEVRRHFGFKIDPKDERFKEVMLQKEKAMKKKMKEEKTKAKQERYMATLMKEEQ